MLHTKYSSSWTCGLGYIKKIFKCFPYIILCKTCDQFWPQGYDLNKVCSGSLDNTTKIANILLVNDTYVPLRYRSKILMQQQNPAEKQNTTLDYTNNMV